MIILVIFMIIIFSYLQLYYLFYKGEVTMLG